MRKTVSGIMLTSLLITILAFQFNIQPAQAQQVTLPVIFENGLSEIVKVPSNDFTVCISISNSPQIDFWALEIQWDPVWLELQTGTVNDVVEGNFMKSHGNTSFLLQDPNNTAGTLPHVECALQSNGSASGSGFLCFVNFRAKYGNDSMGDALITIADPNGRSHLSLKSNQVSINATVDGMVRIIAGPPPGLPMAKFTPSQGAHFNVGDEITINGSVSESGYDILPPLGNLCPITEWRWDIDIGDDGSADLALYGEIQSFVANDTRPIAITLTVTAPDPIPPTSHYYSSTDSEKHVITAEAPSKFGDMGGGAPPKFYYFDGVVDGKDLALFLMCYKGTAPSEVIHLADLGGGTPAEFHEYDGIVDGKDLALFLLCYKGQGPDA